MDPFEGYLRNGDLENATLIAKGRIAEDPGALESHVGLARIAAAKGNTQKAIDILKDQFAKAPQSPLPPAYLAVILDAQGQSEQAAKLAERSIALGGQLPAAFAIAARAKREAGAYQEALMLAEHAVNHAPTLSGAHLEIARCQSALGALSQAEDAYIAVLEHAPQLADAWKELIALELGAGATEIARENLSEALRLHPGHPELVLLAQNFESITGAPQQDEVSALCERVSESILEFDYNDALDALDELEVVAERGDPRLLLARGEVAIACGEGKIPPLVHALTQRSRAAPNDWRCKTVLGRLLLRDSAVQNPRMGTAHLEDAWRISGENEIAGLGLVEAWAAMGKSTFAKALCTKLSEADTPIGRLAAGILDGSIEV